VDTHSTLTTADKQTNVTSNAVRTGVRVDLSKYHTTTMAAGYPVSSALILFILSIASKIGAPPSVFHDPKATCVGNVHVDLICPDRNLCPMKTTLGEVRSKVCWFVSSSQSTHRRFATAINAPRLLVYDQELGKPYFDLTFPTSQPKSSTVDLPFDPNWL